MDPISSYVPPNQTSGLGLLIEFLRKLSQGKLVREGGQEGREGSQVKSHRMLLQSDPVEELEARNWACILPNLPDFSVEDKST